jgi:hypothetical protein
MFELNKINDFYNFKCPNCFDEIIVKVNELNCRIFRHAIYKNTFKQVEPHLPKLECDFLTENNLVYGCCKPFEIIIDKNVLYAIKCEYK